MHQDYLWPTQTCRDFHASAIVWTTQHQPCGCDWVSDSLVPNFRRDTEQRTLMLQCSPKFTNTEMFVYAMGFCPCRISGHILTQVYLFNFHCLSSTSCPEFANESNEDRFRKITEQKYLVGKTNERPLGADTWLCPRLTLQLQLAQEPKDWRTYYQKSQIIQFTTSLELQVTDCIWEKCLPSIRWRLSHASGHSSSLDMLREGWFLPLQILNEKKRTFIRLCSW